MANTVIFKWNPAISSNGMYSFLNEILDSDDEGAWSVRDHDRIHVGDIFYMLKVGKGQNGIVKRGTITSEPVADEDWSGCGRETWYCYYEAEIMISPDTFDLLTSERLREAIPDFDWFGGHSGVVLNETQAASLEALWQQYLQESKEEFKSRLELMERRGVPNDQLFLSWALEDAIRGVPMADDAITRLTYREKTWPMIRRELTLIPAERRIIREIVDEDKQPANVDQKFTEAAWRKLKRMLAACDFDSWQEKYENLMVLDGTSWYLEIQYGDGRVKKVEGMNEYPPAWERFMNVCEYCGDISLEWD